MTELTQDLSLAQAHSLIDSYDFDLGDEKAEQLLQHWLNIYHASWIRLATIEALYLGRYKAISIEHILNVWLRIGNPNTHFTYEFERLICRKLPKHLSNLSSLAADDKLQTAEKENFFEEQQSPAKVAIKPREKTLLTKDNDPLLNLATAWEKSQITTPLVTKPHQSQATNIPIINALQFAYTPDWSEFTQGNKMIPQFIPLPDVSSFFHRLKTFGEEKA